MTSLATLDKNLFTKQETIAGVLLPSNIFSLLGEDLKIFLQEVLRVSLKGRESVCLGKVSPKAHVEGEVYIAPGVVVEEFSYIKGPCYIGEGSHIRHGAYIRGNVLVGKDCIVGHSTEVKGSVFLDGAKAAHFGYVGDSVLCQNVNLGAGTRLANLKLAKNMVSYTVPVTGERASSGLKKFGAILADGAQTGCNSVLSPGTLLMKDTGVFPCVHYQGTLEKGFVRNS